MRRIMAVFMGMLVCLVAGCMRGAPENDLEVAEVAEVLVTTEVLDMGRTAYRKYCVQCHGYSGKGDGTSATSFDPPPRDYTDAEVMNEITDFTLAETIRFGGIDRGFPNMPAFPNVNHDEHG
jgi:mono/diheme cytochrome c family protein